MRAQRVNVEAGRESERERAIESGHERAGDKKEAGSEPVRERRERRTMQ